MQRAGAMGADVLTMAGIVFSLPFLIIGLALPIVLVVRLLLWIGQRF